MDILKIVVSSTASMAALFGLTKIMGNREMSQLSMFDYVSSIAVGSIAGEMAVMSTDSLLEPFIAMVVYTVMTILISLITCKSMLLRRFFEGHVLLLYQNGQLYEKNLLKAKLDLSELLSELRINGFFDLEQIHTIYLESNGRISVIPKASDRPVTPSDLNLSPNQQYPMANIIMDGKIMNENLIYTGKDKVWVDKQLKAHKVSDIKEVMLATYDINNDKLNVYLKYHKKMDNDILE